MELCTLPSSFAQRRLWFLNQIAPDNPFYNLSIAVPIDAVVDVRAMRLALNEIVRRHETLRTTFGVIDGEPHQLVVPTRLHEVPLTDLTALPGARRTEEATRLASVDALTPFDLAAGPLLRTRLVRLAPACHLLLVTMHHIVSDAWSMGVFWNELTTLYAAAARGRPPSLPELPIQYADYAAWQRDRLTGGELERLLDYWTRQLQGMTALELPCDRPRPPVLSYSGATTTFMIQDVLRDIELLAEERGATTFMVLLAAYVALLHRYTGQSEIVVGVPISNRNRPELEGLIGFFVNSLVLRVAVHSDEPFRELVDRVRQVALGGFAHQELPFERLVEELAVERDMSRNPLFQVTFQHLANRSAETVVEQPAFLDVRRGTAIFDFAMTTRTVGGGIRGSAEYNTDLFDAATAERMVAHFSRLVRDAVADPGRRLGEIAMLSDSERDELLAGARGPVMERPNETRLHDLVRAQSIRSPDGTAIRCGDERVTYAQLISRAQRLARALAARGVGRGAIVGVMIERSVDMVVAVLASLEAGAGYLPLDPSEHSGRLHAIVSDARPDVIIVSGSPPAMLTGHEGIPVVDAAADHDAGECVVDDVGPEDLAYVIYTSGSTGTPKGVAMPHRAAVNQMQWMVRAYNFGPADVVLHKTPMGFDASIWELFVPLASGGQVVLAEPGGHRDVGYLARTLDDAGVTTIQMIPSQLDLLLEEPDLARCRTLRRVFAGGEPLDSSIAAFFFDSVDAELHNLYGPTETCIQVVVHRCVPDSAHGSWSQPIGRPIDNMVAFVLDPSMGLAPDGVAGELYIGGPGLARGYVGRPGETAERFVPDPYGARPGGRLYRTGDVVRRRADGTLQFLGRRDQQVKVRGHRVELGEIEAVLRGHPDVADAVVTHRPLAEDGDPELVAYVIARQHPGPGDDALRNHVARQLADHMVPSVFVELDCFPLLASGKPDRAALEPPGRVTATDRTPPRDAVETLMADVWCDVLGMDSVGIGDNFFSDLRGHSLLATRLVSRIRELFRTDMPLVWIFQYPTVSELVEAMRRDPAERVRLERLAQVLVDVAACSDDEVDRLLGAG
jgi:amino acid adenylation domain-containing protein